MKKYYGISVGNKYYVGSSSDNAAFGDLADALAFPTRKAAKQHMKALQHQGLTIPMHIVEISPKELVPRQGILYAHTYFLRAAVSESPKEIREQLLEGMLCIINDIPIDRAAKEGMRGYGKRVITEQFGIIEPQLANIRATLMNSCPHATEILLRVLDTTLMHSALDYLEQGA